MDAREQGVVLRFGQFHRSTTPGLHFKIPYVEEMTKVDVESVRKEEFGFRTRTATAGAAYDRKGFDMEALMLTGDKDVIEVAWIVQYKVSDPVLFLCKVRDVAQIRLDNALKIIMVKPRRSVLKSTVRKWKGLQPSPKSSSFTRSGLPIGIGESMLCRSIHATIKKKRRWYTSFHMLITCI